MTPAEALRAATDPDAVQVCLAAFPDPEEVGCRQKFDPGCVLDGIPQGLDDRLAKLEARRNLVADELQADLARYLDIRSRKLEALSDYDITISSTNNPLGALHMSLSLKCAHISYGNSKLQALEQAILDTRARMQSERPQLALF